MNFDFLIDAVSKEKWGIDNYRHIKEELVTESQSKLQLFSPVSNSSYKSNPIQVLDFFSGAGGTSLGFAAINLLVPIFDMLGGCDINEVSANTYSHNFGTPLIHDDIVRLANNPRALDELLSRIGFNRNKPVILIGCAPCQGFSSHRKKHWNEEDDIRNSLVMSFAKLVKTIQPDVILMENVPEFLSKRYWSYFSAAKKAMKNRDTSSKKVYITPPHLGFHKRGLEPSS